ncbi:MAG: hypothetical protein ACKV22_12400 [Bryobacteraceae bacterium]
MRDLEEAQQGFDRARLLAFPLTQHAEDIPLDKLLVEIVDNVRGVFPDVLPPQFQDEHRWIVRGTRIRLWYAFRDLILLACLLGKRSVSVFLNRLAGDRIQALVQGGSSSLIVPQGVDPLDFLCSPDSYLVAHDGHPAERSIGLQLARDLIKHAGGQLSGRLQPEVEFSIELPSTMSPQKKDDE